MTQDITLTDLRKECIAYQKNFNPILEDDPCKQIPFHAERGKPVMAIDKVELSKSTYFGKWTVRGRALLSQIT